MVLSSVTQRFVVAAAATLTCALGVTACSSSSSTSASSGGASGGTAVDQALRGELPSSVRSSNTLSLGALFQTPPYISADSTNPNTPVGSVPDLAAAVGKVLGVKIEWRNLQWPAQLPAVQAGSIDALWGQVTDTADREKSVVNLVPFQQTTASLLLSKKLAGSVKSLADMCGKKVAVANGSVQAKYVATSSAASCPGNAIKAVAYPDATSAITAVQGGTVDAWMNETSAQVLAAKKTGLAIAAIPTSEAAVTYTAVAIGKSDTGTTSAVVGALKAVINDGTYAKIMDKWNLGPSKITADEVKANPLTGIKPGAQS